MPLTSGSRSGALGTATGRLDGEARLCGSGMTLRWMRLALRRLPRVRAFYPQVPRIHVGRCLLMACACGLLHVCSCDFSMMSTLPAKKKQNKFPIFNSWMLRLLFTRK